MSKLLLFVLFLFIVPFHLLSQVLPREGSKLNYRLVGFSFPQERNASRYKIEIAAGNYSTVDSFKKHVIQSAVSDSNKVMAEVPSFGSQYTWQVVYTAKKAAAIHSTHSPLYHFSTMMNDHVDTGKLRLRILQPAEEYKDAYVAMDAGGVLYDMTGRPVWYIPDTNGFGGFVGAMQFTPEGTVTFLYGKKNYEINGSGAVLWQTPDHVILDGDTVVTYFHHEFIKRPNGHYMMLGFDTKMCKLVSTKDTSYIIVSNDKKKEKEGYKLGRFGAIIEYDEKDSVVWSWRTSKYLIGSDFDYDNSLDSNIRFDPHDNTFYFDEKNNWIYLGFRNLNRILKIEYPSGKILRTYGENFKPGNKGIGGGLFCNLHNISRSQEGYLYFFNNNSCMRTDSLPTVVMLQEPASPDDTFKKIWEYTCTVEGNNHKLFYSGGSALELPDRSMFVCMGSDYSKVFIVNRDKKILWSALPERYMENESWTPIKEYRANIITRKDLEHLIWNAETYTSPR